MITLGIIGIIAALTIPQLIKNYQQKVLKEQFKVAYSLLLQTWRKVEADWEYLPECYYWDKNPYGTVKCVEYDANGGCKKYTLADGSSLPSDYNGKTSDCKRFMQSILDNLQVISKCEGQAYKKGCIPEYEGIDTVMQANKPDLSEDEAYSQTSGCGYFRKNAILNDRTVYVFKNGMIFMPYSDGPNIFAVDINGNKGPNKWGYDLFSFQTKSNINSPLKIVGGGCMYVEKGGHSTQYMIENINSVK